MYDSLLTDPSMPGASFAHGNVARGFEFLATSLLATTCYGVQQNW
jgi:hypothetical protein